MVTTLPLSLSSAEFNGGACWKQAINRYPVESGLSTIISEQQITIKNSMKDGC